MVSAYLMGGLKVDIPANAIASMLFFAVNIAEIMLFGSGSREKLSKFYSWIHQIT
jgi:hypothetical protein